ncbi:unnamed protein product [Diabrotica balteata]|uniref:PHD-type domain-containing protein n=1 Tax=Diabrotica balteata TaxID=107213 RepID=A0A9N9T0E3_DIABA|nr:unnamed protein product [Diabrotica balteata]
MKMEIDTLSNYEQRAEKPVDNTMDVDLTENDGTNSPVEKVSEDGKSTPEPKENANKEIKETDTSVVESESDEDCEEVQEKLLLSPAHSDGGEPLSPVNRDLLDSDGEGEREESDRLDQDVDNDETDKAPATESIQNNDESETESNNATDKDNDRNDKTDIDSKENEENCDSIKKGDEEESSKDDEESSKDDKESGKDEVEDAKTVDRSDNENSSDIIDKTEDAVRKEVADDADEDETKKHIGDIESETMDKTEESKEADVKENEKIEESKEAAVGENEKTVADENVEDIEKKDKESKQKDKEKSDAEDTKEDNEKKESGKTNSSEENKISQEDKEEVVQNVEDGDKEASTKTESNSTENESVQNSKDDKNDQKVSEKEGEDDVHLKSLLKETLMKPVEDFRPDDDDIDMDEDFDPSLLMPELSMEVEEAPVITHSDAPAPEPDGSKSPLRLYDPIFSTFVDEITGAEIDFNLTAEELELKSKTFGEKNPVQLTKIHCTACNIHLGSALDGQGNRFVHPLLKVLICKKCYHFYTSGEFEKDEDGSELYCRWCGQGGQVMCCANCEMVFCKKCIRINFDRRKLAEIQKSDDWTCFRCNPSQLINLRVHCAEFMEYVQREMRNASNDANPENFMKVDHCQCCIPQKKKAPEPSPKAETASTRKRKRYVEPDDPDYNPLKDRESPPPSGSSTPTQQKMPALTPKPQTVLNSTVATKPPTLRPMVTPIVRPRMPVTSTGRPQAGYVRVAPGTLRAKAPVVTPVATALRPIRPINAIKHEWFEKTVRAAARVNSNLSYTLTQLNRAQANATSVEALAVVHNKLQEILSSSINSLIQIRKNLRTEFIAGIKNIRFPPTSKPSNTPTSKDDDDVIFVDDSAPKPTTTTATLTTPTLPPGLSLIKRTQATVNRSNSPSTTPVAGPSGVNKTTKTTPSKPSTSTGIQAKGFLRVKSFSALQSVTSECITIPDDPADDADVLPVVEKDPLEMVEVVDDKEEDKSKEVEAKKEVKSKDDDKKGNTEVKSSKEVNSDENVKIKDDKEEEVRRTNGMTNGNKDVKSLKAEKHPASPRSVDSDSERPLKKAKIIIERSSEIDKMAKNSFGVVNGTSDESEKEVEN